MVLIPSRARGALVPSLTFVTVRCKNRTIARTATASNKATPQPMTLLPHPAAGTETRGCGRTSPWSATDGAPPVPFPVAARSLEGDFAQDASLGSEHGDAEPLAQGTGLPVMPVAASRPDLKPS